LLEWVLKFSTWFLKNVLFEQKKVKLWNKQHFLENKTNYAACIKNTVNVFVPKYIKWIFRGCFSVCTQVFERLMWGDIFQKCGNLKGIEASSVHKRTDIITVRLKYFCKTGHIHSNKNSYLCGWQSPWRFYCKVFVLDELWTSSWVQVYCDWYWILIW
jgi:hypothetical protein